MLARLFTNLLPYVFPCESWRACFNLSHSFTLINLFTTIRALIEFKPRHGVGPSLELVHPVPANALDFITTTGWADSNFQHRIFSLEAFSSLRALSPLRVHTGPLLPPMTCANPP